MRLTRRAVTLAGLGTLATGALSSPAMAIDGPLEDLVEGAEDFGTLQMPMFTAIRSSRWK